jgi:hypothetical protein
VKRPQITQIPQINDKTLPVNGCIELLSQPISVCL